MLQSRKLKEEKEKLIGVWMELQDKADGINERVHLLTREIESLNLRIAEALKREAHEAQKKNGKARPNGRPKIGNSHPK